MSDIPAAVRDEVLDRDDYRCTVCGLRGTIEVHHVIPRSRAFSVENVHDANNLTCLCPACHQACTQGRLLVDRVQTQNGWCVFFKWL